MAGTKQEIAQKAVLNAHFSEHFYSPQSRRERRENYHAFGRLLAVKPCPQGLGLFLFAFPDPVKSENYLTGVSEKK